ncbi:hypothetical protein JQ633_33425 [Bradyrhizobium tropiciagri]|nr:hypothetical protein [Bradyrhizobium tropiciagri]
MNWLLTGVGRAYLAYCPAKERPEIVEMLRTSNKAEDRLAREPARLNTILAEVRARGYATRDPTHVGRWYGKPPHADGLISIAVPCAVARAFWARSTLSGSRPPFRWRASPPGISKNFRTRQRKLLVRCEVVERAEDGFWFRTISKASSSKDSVGLNGCPGTLQESEAVASLRPSEKLHEVCWLTGPYLCGIASTGRPVCASNLRFQEQALL